MRFFFCLFALLTTTHIQAAPNVMVSIRPLHSLVSGVMQGVTEPALLLDSAQSPHHTSLKPSDRRRLARADLIFWIGPELESSMPKLLENLHGKARVVALIETEQLTRLPLRQSHREHDDTSLRTDGHIWLDTLNVTILVDEISRHLIEVDPANSQQYLENQKKLHESINALREKLHLSLGKNLPPFLSYHDAYQYFEHEFGLRNIGFVTNSHELQPSARRILELKKTIKHTSIQCLFYDAPFRPPVINTLLAETRAKAIALDPIGIKTAAGPQAWFQIMQSLADSFKDCLQPD